MSSGIRVRNFRRSDLAQVRDVFILAFSTGPGSPRRLALESSLMKPTNQVAYFVTVAGFAMAISSRIWAIKVLGAVLFFGALTALLAYRYRLSKIYTDWYDTWLSEDLADVATFYKLVPVKEGCEDLMTTSDNGFWVAECDRPDKSGTEIVGCVALGAHALRFEMKDAPLM
ncbi:hypothetical protein H0H92_010672 [Tricholoma furcatifolium]|nr:hypothetical protein H0H92_010672 [Tricholoma furcatifolium]